MSAQLSPFLRKKYEYLFVQFYDTNKNGVITHSDFIDMRKGLKKFRNWSDDDERLISCELELNNAWHGLKQGADANKDQRVTKDEWFDYWASFVKQSRHSHSSDGWPPGIPWIKEYMLFWFDMLDASGDGFVDENEYVTVCHHFGVDKNEAKKAFAKLNEPKIDRDYFSRLWLEFMTSDDETSPGNFIFGKANW